MADPTTHAGFKANNGSTAGLSKTTIQGEPRNGGTVSGTLANGFLTGTQIVAPEGEVPVERLAIGFPVLTFNEPRSAVDERVGAFHRSRDDPGRVPGQPPDRVATG
jgi:hypothetical protein